MSIQLKCAGEPAEKGRSMRTKTLNIFCPNQLSIGIQQELEGQQAEPEKKFFKSKLGNNVYSLNTSQDEC